MKFNLNWRKFGWLSFTFFFLKGMLWLALLLGAGKIFSQTVTSKNTRTDMQVAVYDTYVTKKDGQVMHFDILVPSEFKNLEQIYAYGQKYLATKGQEGQPLTSKECKFCHVEQAPKAVKEAIEKQGFYIIEMQGCN